MKLARLLVTCSLLGLAPAALAYTPDGEGLCSVAPSEGSVGLLAALDDPGCDTVRVEAGVLAMTEPVRLTRAVALEGAVDGDGQHLATLRYDGASALGSFITISADGAALRRLDLDVNGLGGGLHPIQVSAAAELVDNHVTQRAAAWTIGIQLTSGSRAYGNVLEGSYLGGKYQLWGSGNVIELACGDDPSVVRDSGWDNTITPCVDGVAARSDAALTSATTPVSVAVLANDQTPDPPLHVASFTQGAGGRVEGLGDVLVYTAAAGFVGDDSFSYTVVDGAGATATATVSVRVLRPNAAPLAAPLTLATPEDTTVSGQLTALDPDGDPIVFSLVSSPVDGQLALASDGAFTFAPAPDQHGRVTFLYVAADDLATSEPAALTIDVLPVNDPPVASDTQVRIDADEPLVGSLWAFDPDGDALTFELVQGPAHGTVDLAPSGAFTFIADPDFSGEDAVTFLARDGEAASAVATLWLVVAADCHIGSAEAEADPEAIQRALDDLACARVVLGPGVYRPAAPLVLPSSHSSALVGVTDGAGRPLATIIAASGDVAIDVAPTFDGGRPSVRGLALVVGRGMVGVRARTSADLVGNHIHARGGAYALEVDAPLAVLEGNEVTGAWLAGIAFFASHGRASANTLAGLFDIAPYVLGMWTGNTTIERPCGTPSDVVVALGPIYGYSPVELARPDGLCAAPDRASTLGVTPVAVDVLDNDAGFAPIGLASFSAPDHGVVVRQGDRLVYTAHEGFVGTDRFGYVLVDGAGNSAPGEVVVDVTRPCSVASAAELGPTLDDARCGRVLLEPGVFTVGGALVVYPGTTLEGALDVGGGLASELVAPAGLYVRGAPGQPSAAVRDLAVSQGLGVGIELGHGAEASRVRLSQPAPEEAFVGVRVAGRGAVARDIVIAGTYRAGFEITQAEGALVSASRLVGTFASARYLVAADAATVTLELPCDEDADAVRDPSGVATILRLAPASGLCAVPDLVEARAGESVVIDPMANDLVSAGPLELVDAAAPAEGALQVVGGRLVYTAPASFRGEERLTYTVRDVAGATSSAVVVVRVLRVCTLSFAGQWQELIAAPECDVIHVPEGEHVIVSGGDLATYVWPTIRRSVVIEGERDDAGRVGTRLVFVGGTPVIGAGDAIGIDAPGARVALRDLVVVVNYSYVLGNFVGVVDQFVEPLVARGATLDVARVTFVNGNITHRRQIAAIQAVGASGSRFVDCTFVGDYSLAVSADGNGMRLVNLVAQGLVQEATYHASGLGNRIELACGQGLADVSGEVLRSGATIVPAGLCPEDDVAATSGTTPVVVDVLANDTTTAAPLRLVSWSAPRRGSVTRDGDRLVYTPAPDTGGAQGFEYTVSDALGRHARARVEIGVTGPCAVDPRHAATLQGKLDDPLCTSVTLAAGSYWYPEALFVARPIRLSGTRDASGVLATTLFHEGSLDAAIAVADVGDGARAEVHDLEVVLTGIATGVSVQGPADVVGVRVRTTNYMGFDAIRVDGRDASVRDNEVAGDWVSGIAFVAPATRGEARGNVLSGTYQEGLYRVGDAVSDTTLELACARPGTSLFTPAVNIAPTATGTVVTQATPASGICALGDDLEVVSGEVATLDVLANDFTRDAPLALVSVGDPAHGTASVDGDVIIYEAEPGWVGEDGFDYVVASAAGATEVAHVSLSVSGPCLVTAAEAVDEPGIIQARLDQGECTEVRLGAGDFWITEPLRIERPLWLSGARDAAGALATRLHASGFYAHTIEVTGVWGGGVTDLELWLSEGGTFTGGVYVEESSVTLARLTLRQQNPAAYPIAVRVWSGHGLTVQGLRVEGSWAIGFDLEYADSSTLRDNRLRGVYIVAAIQIGYLSSALTIALPCGESTTSVVDLGGWFGGSPHQIVDDCVNHPPEARADAYLAARDRALVVPASLGVLANDADGDAAVEDAPPAYAAPLTAALVSGPSHGALTLSPDGALRYVPAVGFYGSDTFTYVTRDGLGATSAPATVTLTVPHAPHGYVEVEVETADRGRGSASVAGVSVAAYTLAHGSCAWRRQRSRHGLGHLVADCAPEVVAPVDAGGSATLGLPAGDWLVVGRDAAGAPFDSDAVERLKAGARREVELVLRSGRRGR